MLFINQITFSGPASNTLVVLLFALLCPLLWTTSVLIWNIDTYKQINDNKNRRHFLNLDYKIFSERLHIFLWWCSTLLLLWSSAGIFLLTGEGVDGGSDFTCFALGAALAPRDDCKKSLDNPQHSVIHFNSHMNNVQFYKVVMKSTVIAQLVFYTMCLILTGFAGGGSFAWCGGWGTAATGPTRGAPIILIIFGLASSHLKVTPLLRYAIEFLDTRQATQWLKPIQILPIQPRGIWF